MLLFMHVATMYIVNNIYALVTWKYLRYIAAICVHSRVFYTNTLNGYVKGTYILSMCVCVTYRFEMNP